MSSSISIISDFFLFKYHSPLITNNSHNLTQLFNTEINPRILIYLRNIDLIVISHHLIHYDVINRLFYL